jgi:outer membrane protein OmpA-like peptidoglycan-associated protein
MRVAGWLAVVVVGLSGTAFAAEPPAVNLGPSAFTWTGLSVGGQVGGGWAHDKVTESNAFVPPQTGSSDTSFAGAVFGAHLGYSWAISRIVLGIEGDVEATTLDGKSTCSVEDAGVGNAHPGSCFPQAGSNYSAETSIPWQTSVRARVGYAFGGFLPYLTGGVAIGGVNTKYSSAGASGIDSQTFRRVRVGPTVGAGLEYAAYDNWTLRLEYRYTDFGRFTDDITNGGGFYDGYSEHHTVQEHAFRIGISYWFNAPLPSPVPAAVAAPAPAPARSYLVFFDWDKATLTARAQQIIQEAAANSTKVQYTRIEVNGYTDTSGTPQYNQGLSVRRAQAVAAELVRDGVPKNAIAIQGFGETHLLVPTGPGVREPQNRRVEIIIR